MSRALRMLPFLLLAALPAAAQNRPRAIFREPYDRQVQEAIDRGLAWLAAHQEPDGSWACRIGYKLYEDYHGEEGHDPGVTALGGMAFAGAGHVPNRGRYGAVAARALEFILSCVGEESGYITRDGSRMYSHAFATMYLAEIHGMSPRPDLRWKLQAAVNLIRGAQNQEGGWRYGPTPIDADLSVTVSTLQALRAARNTGIDVPLETIERAVAYVRRCAVPGGAFRYQGIVEYSMSDPRTSYPLTACGVVALYSAGEYESREVQSGLRALSAGRGGIRRPAWNKYHYFYGHYYASQAMYMAGRDMFDPYYERVRDEILAGQKEDGSWHDDVGPTYATAMAVIVLQMPCEILPLFQK